MIQSKTRSSFLMVWGVVSRPLNLKSQTLLGQSMNIHSVHGKPVFGPAGLPALRAFITFSTILLPSNTCEPFLVWMVPLRRDCEDGAIFPVTFPDFGSGFRPLVTLGEHDCLLWVAEGSGGWWITDDFALLLGRPRDVDAGRSFRRFEGVSLEKPGSWVGIVDLVRGNTALLLLILIGLIALDSAPTDLATLLKRPYLLLTLAGFEALGAASVSLASTSSRVIFWFRINKAGDPLVWSAEETLFFWVTDADARGVFGLFLGDFWVPLVASLPPTIPANWLWCHESSGF